jgi:hypothetical protein
MPCKRICARREGQDFVRKSPFARVATTREIHQTNQSDVERVEIRARRAFVLRSNTPSPTPSVFLVPRLLPGHALLLSLPPPVLMSCGPRVGTECTLGCGCAGPAGAGKTAGSQPVPTREPGNQQNNSSEADTNKKGHPTNCDGMAQSPCTELLIYGCAASLFGSSRRTSRICCVRPSSKWIRAGALSSVRF